MEPETLLSLPVGIFGVYLNMLPRLVAEESMLAVQRVAMGSGTLEEQTAKRIRRAWDEMANTGPREAKKPKFDRAASDGGSGDQGSYGEIQ